MSSMLVRPCRREASHGAEATFSLTISVVRRLSLSVVVLALAAACHSADPAVLKADAIRRGDDLVQQKQYAEAVSAYQDAVKNDPKDAGLRLKLAAAHRLANQWAAAAHEAAPRPICSRTTERPRCRLSPDWSGKANSTMPPIGSREY